MSGRRFVLLAVLAWSGLFAALETYRTTKLYINRPWSEDQPSLWRLGSDPVLALRGLAERVDERLEEPTRLAFASPLSGEEGHILHMWTAYLLPRHEVVPAADPASAAAGVWLAYGAADRRPTPERDASLLYAEEQGALYRLGEAEPPPESEP